MSFFSFLDFNDLLEVVLNSTILLIFSYTFKIFLDLLSSSILYSGTIKLLSALISILIAYFFENK